MDPIERRDFLKGAAVAAAGLALAPSRAQWAMNANAPAGTTNPGPQTISRKVGATLRHTLGL